MANTFNLGSVVISTAGRDSGKSFVIVRVLDDSYVYIADGSLRRLAKPKKKKIKHITLTAHMLDGIGEKLKEGKKVFDAEIRSALINIKDAGSVKQEEE